MVLKVLSGIGAMVLFIGYFGPIVFKLKEVSLAVVVCGGVLLAGVDAWQAVANRKG